MLVSSGPGQQTVRKFNWQELEEQGLLKAGEVVKLKETVELKRANDSDTPKTFEILTVNEPDVGAPAYALVGQVRHDDVEGKAYLEMWNYFEDGGRHFSRTLAETGPMQFLSGSSGLRGFLLPFSLGSEDSEGPVKLDFNIFFPGPGEVYLSDIELIQYKNSSAVGSFSEPGDWWSSRAGGWIGGIGGSTIGISGAIIGILAGLGKARKLVMVLFAALIIVGIASLCVGVAAVFMSQPYAVYYPLLLGGGILTVVLGLNYKVIRRRYTELEIRKMTARDLGKD